MLAFLVPIALLVFLVCWTWAIIESLRQERDYIWLILLMVAPPLGIAGYFVNFRILGDERAGLTAFRRRVSARRRVAALAHRQARGDGMPADHEEKAQLHVDLQEWEAALRELAHVLEFDPENVKAQHLAATCLVRLGRAERALPHYEFIFDHAPTYLLWRPSIEYADALAALNRHGEAGKVLDRVAQALSIPEVVVKLARAEIAEGRRDAARARLEAMLADHAERPDFNARRDAPWVAEARKLLSPR